ncbi:hypothetical protein TWF694_001846 [Orbilia ellipsospora]|uniref:C2H2-type domain-containing protein n=1 Tax=Orbilia ellipsospora TaxID=2528407 RepID=A0AAV9X430_9PEZI
MDLILPELMAPFSACTASVLIGGYGFPRGLPPEAPNYDHLAWPTSSSSGNDGMDARLARFGMTEVRMLTPDGEIFLYRKLEDQFNEAIYYSQLLSDINLPSSLMCPFAEKYYDMNVKTARADLFGGLLFGLVLDEPANILARSGSNDRNFAESLDLGFYTNYGGDCFSEVVDFRPDYFCQLLPQRCKYSMDSDNSKYDTPNPTKLHRMKSSAYRIYGEMDNCYCCQTQDAGHQNHLYQYSYSQPIEPIQENVPRHPPLAGVPKIPENFVNSQITAFITTETVKTSSSAGATSSICDSQNMNQSSHIQTNTISLSDVGILTPHIAEEQGSPALQNSLSPILLQSTTSSTSETRTRKQKHHALKPDKIYTCQAHNIQTSSDRLFGEHMWQVHEIKYFACPNCSWRTARLDNLKRDHTPRCQQKLQKAAQLLLPAGSKTSKRVSLKDLTKPLTFPTTPISIEGYHDTPASKTPNRMAPDLKISQEEMFREMQRKLMELEQENRSLREDRSILEDDLEEARCDRDMWHEECKRLRQENRRRLKQDDNGRGSRKKDEKTKIPEKI